MKRVLILSSGVGQGHHAAAHAIARALTDRYPEAIQPVVVNVLDHPDTANVWRESQSDYDKIATDLPQLHEIAQRLVDSTLIRGVSELGHVVALYRPISSIIQQHRPDVIVSLYPAYQSTILFYLNQQNSRIPLLTVPTDMGRIHRTWLHPGVDVCLLPDQTAAERARAFGLLPEQVRVTGIPVHPALNHPAAGPKEERRIALGWAPDLFTLLVVGSKRLKAIEPFTHLLNHAGFPLQLILVAGGNGAAHDYFQAQTWHRPVHIYNFVDHLPEMMLAADAVLTKAGGLITAESLAAGLPLLFIQALLSQEKGNAAFVTAHGAGDLVEEPLLLLETLCHWLAGEGALYQQRVAQARRLGRPDAAEAVAKVVVQKATTARMARPGLTEAESSLRDFLLTFGIML